jgi:hypothetical protein
MFLVMAVALLAPASSAAAQQFQQTFWAMVVNDVPKGDVIAVLDGPNTWVPVAALDDAGLRRFGATAACCSMPRTCSSTRSPRT